MPEPTRTSTRLYLLMGVATVVALLSGGVVWTSIAFPTPIAPPLVRVTGTMWSGIGCDLTNFTGPGFVVAESTSFTVNGSVENLDPASSCDISAVAVGPGGFALLNDSTPIVLSPYGSAGDSATIEVGLRAPGGWATSSLQLLLMAHEGA
jgi:hypothetical protein